MHLVNVVLRILTLILVLLPSLAVLAQETEQSGWLAWFNNYKLSSRWSIISDVQLRSADRLAYSKHLLLRPGLTFKINDHHSATAGYGYIRNYSDPGEEIRYTLTEHRIWEQYIYNHQIQGLPLTHRLRIEQRFIERPTESIFAQRLRYFARTMVPFKKDNDTFNNGWYAALQNEIFLNISNRAKLNGSAFDQNRAYLGVGYRLGSRADIEAGYLNQYINGAGANTRNNVLQLALYTRF